jgi:CheY-like chemotaxis protein
MNKQTEKKNQTGQTAKSRDNVRSGYRVLLADDDSEMRRLLAWSLNRKGYQITECKDGNAMMKKLGLSVHSESDQPFDLIISDIRMPGSTGIQILESAHNIKKLPPMILITAFPDDETRKKARQLGAAAVVEKPFDVDALVDSVREILPFGLSGKSPSPNSAPQHGPSLSFPMEITFRHGKGVEAIRAFICDMATKLNPLAHDIRRVHVVVEDLSPEAHRKHRHHISIQIVINNEKPVVVSHNTDHTDNHENLCLGIHTTFGIARRQLKHALGKRRAKRVTRREPSPQEIIDK